MRRSNRGYGNYRGRRTAGDILKYVAIGLAALVVVALAGLLWAQEYIVYTEDGWYLSLFREEEEPPPLPDPGEVSYTEQTPEEPEPEPEAEVMRAVQLPLSAVLDGTAEEQLAQAGANALILEVKDPEGDLVWRSQQLVADQARGNGDEEVNRALEDWNRGEVYTIARVCCFRDNSAPYNRNDLALRSSGGNWRDELGLRWLSPARQEARDYLAGLCGELAGLGFDEILLECAAFPTGGNLAGLQVGDAYDPDRLSQWEEAFLEEVARALEPSDAVLSLRVDRANLEEGGGGLTPELLAEYAGRLWVEEDGDSPALADLAAQIAPGEGAVVAVLPQLTGEERPQAAVN